MMLRGTVADGTIVGFNKGGVLVDIGDLKGVVFLTEYSKLIAWQVHVSHNRHSTCGSAQCICSNSQQ